MNQLKRMLSDLEVRSTPPLVFFDWALQVPEPKSGTLDFVKFPFQKELYSRAVEDREMVVMKSAQVGVSAWALRWALYQSDIHGRTGLYVFPTAHDVHDFSIARIKPVIDRSDYLRGRQRRTDPNNRGLIGIGDGLVYFRGSEARRGLDSVDADYVVFDEYDTLAHQNIPDAERRVTGPLSAGLIRRVGVPTVPGWGIARLYDESDQRSWHIRCARCGAWQVVTFEDNVDQDEGRVVCASCRKPLDVTAGEWVAAYPDRPVPGYHVSRLIAPTTNIASIVAASKKRAGYERQAFFNKDLGIAWAPEEGRLSRAAIEAAQSLGDYTMPEAYAGDKLVTMGVDVASTRALHVRISEHLSDTSKRALFIGEVDGFDALEQLMTRFNVAMAAIDHLPEGRLARMFAERFPGRVYIVAYNTTAQPRSADVLSVDVDMRFATVRRLEAIDAMTEMIRSQRNLLPWDLPDDYVDHLQALVRTVEQNPVGSPRVTYRATGADDFAQAEVYDILAIELWWLQQGMEEATRETFTTLDDHLDFPRSRLGDYDDMTYSPGPDEPDVDAWS
ncbi:MAG: terminase gpA endonuclease subunit [Nocardioidaceae bacterium]